MLNPKQNNKANYSGRVLTTFENGEAINERIVGCHEHIASMEAFLELARVAGWHVSTPESNEVITSNPIDSTHQSLLEQLPVVGGHYTQDNGGDIPYISAEPAIMALVNALVEIGTIAKQADKHVTSETEDSSEIIPQALTLIKLRAIEAIKQVGSMMKDDIRAIDEAKTPKLSGTETPPDFLYALGIYPTTTGRITLYVESGRIIANVPVPEDHITTNFDGFIHLASRAGYCVEPLKATA